MNNNFVNSPTVGSHDQTASNDNIQNRMDRIEQKVDELINQQKPVEKKPTKIWGKIKKFFRTVIKPILTFIPNLINSMANYKRAKAKFI